MARKQSKSAGEKDDAVPFQAMGFGGLVELTSERRELRYRTRGKTVTFSVRGMTGHESNQASEIALVIPPKVKINGQIEDDFLNEEYLKKRRAKANQRSAYVLELCVDGFVLVGKTLAEKAEALNHLPPALVNALENAIDELTSGDVEALAEANFTSPADSTPS